ncbi:MAG TPA: N-acetylmuramoyl-L-alanine amidase [Bacillaceae bacterium]
MQRKKWLTIVAAAMVMYCLIPSLGAAANGSTYKVATSSLNVRTEPSKKADVIGSLPKGTAVQVLEIRYDWAKIQFKGRVGWIASYYLNGAAGEETAVQSTTVSVAADGVRLRSGPGTQYRIIGYTSYGEAFQVIEREGEWVHVRLKGGSSAWIAGWLVSSSSGPAAVATSSNPSNPNNSNISQSQPVSKTGNLAGKTVIIDAGHGGYDPGAIGVANVHEKDLTLRTAHLVTAKLKSAGARVIMTRADDRHLHVGDRVQVSRSFPSAVFISIHYNAHQNPGARGVSTYYYHASDKGLSSSVQQQLAARTPLQNDGVQFGDYYVLRNNHALSILVELGFMTNPQDLGIIQTDNFQNQAAEAIAQGLINYFN